MGVLSSSFLRRPGEGAIGLSSSDGKVPEPGVCSEDAVLVLARLSKPAAAMVAVAVADAMAKVVCRRFGPKRATEESNE